MYHLNLILIGVIIFYPVQNQISNLTPPPTATTIYAPPPPFRTKLFRKKPFPANPPQILAADLKMIRVDFFTILC